MGVLETSHAIGPRIGVGSAHVAKEFAFQQMFAQRGTVKCHERLFFAWTVLMNCLSDQFLTGSSRAGDQQRGVGGGEPFDAIDDGLHLLAGIDNPLETKSLVQSLMQFDVGLLQSDGVGRLFGNRTESVGVKRLFQKVEGPLLHRVDRFGDRAVPRDDDDFAVGKCFLGESQDRLAVHFIHHQVRDDHVVCVLLDQPRPLRA